MYPPPSQSSKALHSTDPSRTEGLGGRHHLPSYALAAFTRLDHSRPAAVSGSGIIPGSRRRSGRSRLSASESSEAEMVAASQREEEDKVGKQREVNMLCLYSPYFPQCHGSPGKSETLAGDKCRVSTLSCRVPRVALLRRS